MCATYHISLLYAWLCLCVKKEMNMSMSKFLTCCCGNRDHSPHLNPIVGVQLGWSRRAGPAPLAHHGPPNALNPDPALGQNLGMLILFFVHTFVILWSHCSTNNKMFLWGWHMSFSYSMLWSFLIFSCLSVIYTLVICCTLKFNDTSLLHPFQISF